MGTRFLALALSMAAACVTSPKVPDPGEAEEPVPLYPDVLLNYTEGGGIGICLDALPPCDEPVTDQCGPDELLAATDVLGEPDEVGYTFDTDGRVDVGFHCGAILETVDPVDLTIYATVPDGKSADVFVSLDGLTYTFIGDLTPAKNEYDFNMWDNIHSARYVRISDTGGGGITIDAIEGLWNGTAP